MIVSHFKAKIFTQKLGSKGEIILYIISYDFNEYEIEISD